ncbi:Imm7 family immunity protein [Amycolatopsis sp. NBC_00438]|uniref:Imm7 family immunity protein n=1 Tax=Amycolatopsis sp. NBC_00438 TaxID=2903558 RepID=UPI002E204958
MYEFHGWFGISENAEDGDSGTLDDGLRDLRARIEALGWDGVPSAAASLDVHNGTYFLIVNGAPNRPAALGTDLTGLLDFVARRFPGSWGLLYERSDDLERPPGPGAFRVRVMARGRLVTRLDPFLSPVNPVIED